MFFNCIHCINSEITPGEPRKDCMFDRLWNKKYAANIQNLNLICQLNVFSKIEWNKRMVKRKWNEQIRRKRKYPKILLQAFHIKQISSKSFVTNCPGLGAHLFSQTLGPLVWINITFRHCSNFVDEMQVFH